MRVSGQMNYHRLSCIVWPRVSGGETTDISDKTSSQSAVALKTADYRGRHKVEQSQGEAETRSSFLSPTTEIQFYIVSFYPGFIEPIIS